MNMLVVINDLIAMSRLVRIRMMVMIEMVMNRLVARTCWS